MRVFGHEDDALEVLRIVRQRAAGVLLNQSPVSVEGRMQVLVVLAHVVQMMMALPDEIQATVRDLVVQVVFHDIGQFTDALAQRVGLALRILEGESAAIQVAGRTVALLDGLGIRRAAGQ